MNKELEAQGFKPVCEARDCYNEYGNNNYDALMILNGRAEFLRMQQIPKFYT